MICWWNKTSLWTSSKMFLLTSVELTGIPFYSLLTWMKYLTYPPTSPPAFHPHPCPSVSPLWRPPGIPPHPGTAESGSLPGWCLGSGWGGSWETVWSCGGVNFNMKQIMKIHKSVDKRACKLLHTGCLMPADVEVSVPTWGCRGPEGCGLMWWRCARSWTGSWAETRLLCSDGF